MIEAVMFWNEPNNKSHWDFEVDPDWNMFAEMVKLASTAVRAENPQLTRVLGGISPIDPAFIRNMEAKGVLNCLDVVAVHGFPLDWNHWTIHEWPDKLQEIRDVTDLPIWISEIGASTFGAEGRSTYFRNPDRQVCDVADLLKLVGPLVNGPMIPVERKTMHGDDVEAVQDALCFHVANECRIDR